MIQQHGVPCGCGAEYVYDHSEFGLPLGYTLRCVKCGRMWDTARDKSGLDLEKSR